MTTKQRVNSKMTIAKNSAKQQVGEQMYWVLVQLLGLRGMLTMGQI